MATVVAPEKNSFENLGVFYLKPGDCKDIEYRFWRSDPQFLVSADVAERDRPFVDAIALLVDQDLLADGEEDNDHLASGMTSEDFHLLGSFPLCVNALGIELAQLESCRSETTLSYFLPSFQILESGRLYSKDWYFFWQHPNLNLSPPDRSLAEGLPFAVSNAKRLHQSLATSFRYKDVEKISWPFSVGGELADVNGPLEAGVFLNSVLDHDIYGKPMPLENGDVIIAFNGVSVYSPLDLMHLLYNHGIDRVRGINEPIIYEILRGNEHLTVSSPYFFNMEYKDYAGDMSGVAFWYGVGDAISFGQTPWATCGLGKGLDIIATGASALAEKLKSWSEDRSYNSANVRTMTVDAAECAWQKTQARAVARQKEDEIYVNSQWFAVFTPSGLRLMAGKAVARGTAKAAGRSVISRGVAGAVLETAESVLWVIGTAPPGTPFSDRMKEGIRFAPLAATAGFVSDAAIKHKAR